MYKVYLKPLDIIDESVLELGLSFVTTSLTEAIQAFSHMVNQYGLYGREIALVLKSDGTDYICHRFDRKIGEDLCWLNRLHELDRVYQGLV
jgi:hypothetical protein